MPSFDPKAKVTGLLGTLLVRIGAPRQSRVGSSPALAPSPGDRRFDVYTFVTDDTQFTAMRASFARAGFEGRANFFALTDRDGGNPYLLISSLAQTGGAPYAILCHQDVRIDLGADAEKLASEVARLDVVDPRWVVAGNMGITFDMRPARRLVDPHGDLAAGLSASELPIPVVSLDENFLVFNRRRNPRCSAGLRGFHLYATDVCLNALEDGGSAWVIDFPLTHLSGGKPVDYRESRRRFLAVWNSRFLFRYVATPIDILFVSRWRTFQRVFGSRRAISCVLHARPRTDWR